MADASAYAAPTPKAFYIHDDLSEYVQRKHGEGSPALQLTQALFSRVQRDAQHVHVLTLEPQIEQLIAGGDHPPFDITIGIGSAGERVAQLLHARTGWFPNRYGVRVTREEDGQGGYHIVSTTDRPLPDQLPEAPTAASVAVVDDTLFSGITMQAVLQALPPEVRARTHAFCLRGVAASIPRITALCPITVGFAAEGDLLDEVSFINASGMVMRVGIRRTGQSPQAFFERPMWMHVWFPGYADDVIAMCEQLNALLEPDGQPATFP